MLDIVVKALSKRQGWTGTGKGLPLSGKNRLAVALLSTLLAASIMFSAPGAEAASQQGRLNQPLYLKQLDNYSREVKLYREEQQRAKSEQRLREALVQHTVQPGETLIAIAERYEVDVGALAYWNGIANPHMITKGQVLDILVIEGTLHRVEEGDTVAAIAGRYGVASSVVADFNLLEQSVPASGDTLVVPGGKLPEEERKTVLALASRSTGRTAAVTPAGGWDRHTVPSFQWPVRGTITSYYGMRDGAFHYGLDIAAPHGSEVKAAASGIVESTGYRGGYGLMLTIDHGFGWNTLYAHNSRLLVNRGERVFTGQPVARVGSTGNATGPHVHLEIIYKEKKLDPLQFLY